MDWRPWLASRGSIVPATLALAAKEQISPSLRSLHVKLSSASSPARALSLANSPLFLPKVSLYLGHLTSSDLHNFRPEKRGPNKASWCRLYALRIKPRWQGIGEKTLVANAPMSAAKEPV